MAGDTVGHRVGAETILLVQDHAPVREISRTILELSGYEVLATEGAEQALSLCGAHPGEIHLLLTEVVLRQMDGRALAEAVSKLRPGIKTLFLTDSFEEDLRRTSGLKASFLQKPITPAALAAKVREVLGRG